MTVKSKHELIFGIDLGIEEIESIETMIRFDCGCWRRLANEDSTKVFNSRHCPKHEQLEKRMDGQ